MGARHYARSSVPAKVVPRTWLGGAPPGHGSLPGMNPDAGRTSAAGPDDDALVAASQRGDQAAFGEIVRRYQRAVYRLAWSLARNASDADDLAQETFVRAWGAIGR